MKKLLIILFTFICLTSKAQLTKEHFDKYLLSDKFETQLLFIGNTYLTAYSLTNGFESQNIHSDKFGHFWVQVFIVPATMELFNPYIGLGLGLGMAMGKEVYDHYYRSGFDIIDLGAGISGIAFSYLIYRQFNKKD